MKPRRKRASGRPGGPVRVRPRRTGLVAATAAIALFAAACGASDETTEAASESADTAAPAQTGPRLDAALFSGEAQTIGGESFDLGSLADKDLVLWFWAPW